MTIIFRVASPGPQSRFPTRALHQRYFEDGTVWCSFHRVATGYCLRFPGLADFTLSADGREVVAIPSPETDEPTIDQLYISQVLPLALSRQGVPVFHASAVEMEGQALAFIGQSGSGKSTLATYLALAGAGLLSDDGLPLEKHIDGYRVTPSPGSVRLWDDSRQALVGNGVQIAPQVAHSSKARMLFGSGIRRCTDPVPLRNAYFLSSAEVQRIHIEPIGAVEAALEWIRHSFLLHGGEHPLLASHFCHVGSLASLKISYRLEYPRNYALLPTVRSALLDHLKRSGKG